MAITIDANNHSVFHIISLLHPKQAAFGLCAKHTEMVKTKLDVKKQKIYIKYK